MCLDLFIERECIMSIMGKVLISMVGWFIFVGISTLLIMGSFLITGYTMTWGNAIVFSVFVRWLFQLNRFYSLLEEEYDI